MHICVCVCVLLACVVVVAPAQVGRKAIEIELFVWQAGVPGIAYFVAATAAAAAAAVAKGKERRAEQRRRGNWGLLLGYWPGNH